MCKNRARFKNEKFVYVISRDFGFIHNPIATINNFIIRFANMTTRALILKQDKDKKCTFLEKLFTT